MKNTTNELELTSAEQEGIAQQDIDPEVKEKTQKWASHDEDEEDNYMEILHFEDDNQ